MRVVLYVPSEEDKHALIASDPSVFFTEPHYDGYAAGARPPGAPVTSRRSCARARHRLVEDARSEEGASRPSTSCRPTTAREPTQARPSGTMEACRTTT